MKISPQERRKRREIYQLLYRIQQRYGTKADMYKFEAGELDPETGEHSAGTREKIALRHFISWDATINQKFEYDISFIKANSNFAYGGLFQVGDRVAIVSRRELQISESFEMDASYYVVMRGERWNIHRFTELDVRAGWFLHLRKVNAQELHQTLEPVVQHFISFEQDITATL